MSLPLRLLAVSCVLAACGRRTRDENTAPVAPAPVAPAPVALAPVAPVAPVAPAPVAPAPTAPPVEPPGAPEPSEAVDALSVGSHRCSFTEGGSDYNRRCRVTALPNGGLQVVARGTALNAEQGFTLTATGAAPRYAVQGALTAFAACTGPFSGTMTLQGPHSRPYYVVTWGQGCQITIQI